jgi:FKBP-type peptidyl-prolyl cis-trans isomerase 2
VEKISAKDFIEIEFTGRVKDGEIFDSNIKQDLEKSNLKIEQKPLIICIGERMFLKEIDDFFVGKEIGKEYNLELTPEKAFGKRNSALVKIIPLKIFHERQLNPHPGMMFNFDGYIAKVISVSGGRVITDFNNPLAGRDVVYKLKINRKISDLNEKIDSFVQFFFRKKIGFEIKDKKLILKLENQYADFVKMFAPKFKELFDLDLEIEENKPTTP